MSDAPRETGLNQLCVVAASDECQMSADPAVSGGDPRRKELRRTLPSRRSLGPPSRATILAVHFGERGDAVG